MTALQPWQEALKRIEGSSAQEELADQLEQEFTRIGAKQKLTKADWISVAAIMASHLVQAKAVQRSVPELAAGLVKLGSLKLWAKTGAQASAEKNAQTRSERANLLRQHFTPETYAKQGAKKKALSLIHAHFGDKSDPEATQIEHRTLRRIAKEAGLIK